MLVVVILCLSQNLHLFIYLLETKMRNEERNKLLAKRGRRDVTQEPYLEHGAKEKKNGREKGENKRWRKE